MTTAPALDLDQCDDTPDHAADLAADSDYASWCDAHRDAWIADLDNANDR